MALAEDTEPAKEPEKQTTPGLKHDPQSLPGLVETLGHLEKIIKFILTSMAGSPLKVNLSSEFHALRRMLDDARVMRRTTSEASAIIERNAPLADKFPDDSATWRSQAKPLSPKQLAYLAALAGSHSAAPGLTSYAEAMADLTAQPPHVEYALQQESIRAELNAAMGRPCPACGVESGKPCRTKTGKATSMHKARWS